MEIFEAFKKNTEQIVSATKVELDKKISKLYAPDGTVVISEHKKDDEVVPGEYDIKVFNEGVVAYAKNAKELNEKISYINSLRIAGTIYITGEISLTDLASLSATPTQPLNFTLEDWENPDGATTSDMKESVINFGNKLNNITIEGYGIASASSINRICCRKGTTRVQYSIKADRLKINNLLFSGAKNISDIPSYSSLDRTSKPIFIVNHSSSFNNNHIYLFNGAISSAKNRDVIELFGNFDKDAKTKGSIPQISFNNCMFKNMGYGSENVASQNTIGVRLSNYTSGGTESPQMYEVQLTFNNCDISTSTDNSEYNIIVTDNRKKNKAYPWTEEGNELNIPCNIKINATHYQISTVISPTRESTRNLTEMYSSIAAFNKARFYGLSEGSPYRLIGINSAGKVMQYDYSQSVLSGESVANRRDEITDAADNSTYPTTKAVKDYVDAAISGGSEYATIDDIDAMFAEPLL